MVEELGGGRQGSLPDHDDQVPTGPSAHRRHRGSQARRGAVVGRGGVDNQTPRTSSASWSKLELDEFRSDSVRCRVDDGEADPSVERNVIERRDGCVEAERRAADDDEVLRRVSRRIGEQFGQLLLGERTADRLPRCEGDLATSGLGVEVIGQLELIFSQRRLEFVLRTEHVHDIRRPHRVLAIAVGREDAEAFHLFQVQVELGGIQPAEPVLPVQLAVLADFGRSVGVPEIRFHPHDGHHQRDDVETVFERDGQA